MEQNKCKKDRHSTFSITLWYVRVTTVAVEIQKCTVGVVELQVTVNYINILNIAQQCFHNKFISPAKVTPK